MQALDNAAWIDAWSFRPKIEAVLARGGNIALRGPSGTGKTLLVRQLAAEQKKQLYTFNMTVHTGVEELKGRFVPRPSEDGQRTVLTWIDGQLVAAMRTGAWIVIEEANFMPEEISSVLYSVLDHRRELILDEHNNEVVKAHEDFRVFLTMNWGYRGTTMLNDAIKNRIDAWFDIPYLPLHDEAALLCSRTGVGEETALNMVKLAQQIREVGDRRIPDVSTRVLLRWAALVEGGLTPSQAAEHTIIPLIYYAEQEKMKLRETIAFFFNETVVRTDLEVGDVVQHTSVFGKKFGVIISIDSTKSGDVAKCSWGATPEEAKANFDREDSHAVTFLNKIKKVQAHATNKR